MHTRMTYAVNQLDMIRDTHRYLDMISDTGRYFQKKRIARNTLLNSDSTLSTIPFNTDKEGHWYFDGQFFHQNEKYKWESLK